MKMARGILHRMIAPPTVRFVGCGSGHSEFHVLRIVVILRCRGWDVHLLKEKIEKQNEQWF